MKYQFIITYNVYRNSIIIGSGVYTVMSETFFLTKEASDKLAADLKENFVSGNYYADQRIIRVEASISNKAIEG